MVFDGLDKNLQEEVKKVLNEAEDKAEGIYQAAEMIVAAKNAKLIRELTEQSERAAADEDYRKSLGLHVLSKEEKEFYEKFKDIKQAITANQIDILPTSIIDRTLDDVNWDDVTSDDDYLYYDHRDHDSMDGLVLVDVVASAAGQRKPQIEIAIHFTLPKYV